MPHVGISQRQTWTPRRLTAGKKVYVARCRYERPTTPGTATYFNKGEKKVRRHEMVQCTTSTPKWRVVLKLKAHTDALGDRGAQVPETAKEMFAGEKPRAIREH